MLPANNCAVLDNGRFPNDFSSMVGRPAQVRGDSPQFFLGRPPRRAISRFSTLSPAADDRSLGRAIPRARPRLFIGFALALLRIPFPCHSLSPLAATPWLLRVSPPLQESTVSIISSLDDILRHRFIKCSVSS